MSRIILHLIGICILLGIISCTQKNYYEESGTVFHTSYEIKYQSSTPLTDKISEEFERFNLSLNPFLPNSVITKINKNESMETDELFITVFKRAQEISEQSNGAFDATAAPLINLWGFGFNKADSITPEMVDSLKTFVGYEKVRLDGNLIQKDDPRTIFNFSAIAKGYACDVIARLLEKEGVENYLIDIGGEMAMKGNNQHGSCWRVGINTPVDDPLGIKKEVKEIVQPCKKCGMATSGDYRNFYIKDGKKYAHTIDPQTGYPAGQNILSATVIADDCMSADGYATAFMSMGLEKALKFAETIPEIDYYFIYSDEQGNHKVVYSKRMFTYLPNVRVPDGVH